VKILSSNVKKKVPSKYEKILLSESRKNHPSEVEKKVLDICSYIVPHYEALHTQGQEYIVRELKELMESRGILNVRTGEMNSPCTTVSLTAQRAETAKHGDII
jgi:hypothetical protein